MYGIYIYNTQEVRDTLRDELRGCEIADEPTDEDVDACLEYMYDKFAELFYESIADFVDENYDRWENEEEDE